MPGASETGRTMIRLHQFAPALGLPNASPFCMKLETWLRMAGLPFEAVNDGNILKAPKGKLPYIEDDGQLLADSSFIIEHLQRKHGITLDAGLTQEQQAQATALQRLFEDSLYWAVVHTRWADAQGWQLTRQAFFGPLPAPLRAVVPLLARRGILAELRGQGMGRHSTAEIHAIACRDLTAVADFLGDKAFMLGDAPRTLDATAHAFLANVLWAPLDTPIRRHAAARPALQAYCQRMKARFYG
jgi:glutathione S-transferase